MLRLIQPLGLRDKLYNRLAKHLPPLPTNFASQGTSLCFGGRLCSLCPTDIGHRSIAWTGFYELALTRQIAKLARLGGMMVDAGANAGYFSTIWTAARPENQVIAFEASPRNHHMFAENVRCNCFERQIELHAVALGKDGGTLAFDLGPEDQTGWGGLAARASSETVRVSVSRLDEVISGDAKVQVLKVDTEGADAWVIEGAGKLLQEHRIKHVFYEENIERMRMLGILPGRAKAILEDYGYSVRALSSNPYLGEFHATWK